MTTDITYFSKLSLEENLKYNFKRAGKMHIWAHTLQVRHNALNLANKFGISPEQASTAALLHDVSRIFPTSQYLELAQMYDLDILPEEKQNTSGAYQGPKYFSFGGKTLFDLRNERGV